MFLLFKKIVATTCSIVTIALVLSLQFHTTVLAQNSNIITTASANANFSTLVVAIKAAGLVDTLNAAGPFTVLAPTNEAFAKIPETTLAKLLVPENKGTLTKILTYHVVAGSVDSTQISKLTSAKSVEGSNLEIAFTDNKVKINKNTTVVSADNKTTNGIIHGIDTVLLPTGVDLSKLADTKSVMVNDAKLDPTIRSGGVNNLSIILGYSSIILVMIAQLCLFVFDKPKF